MNYFKIQNFDTGNARGLSLVIWVSGCTHYCEQCFNKEAWDFNAGKELTPEKIKEVCNALDNPHIKNLVISGGDPLHPDNLEGTLLILTGTKSIRAKREQSIIIYTGYTFKELQERAKNELALQTILKEVNYIIDGKYDNTKKPKGLDYRGSYNQRCWRRGDLGWYDFSDLYFREPTLDDKIGSLEKEN